MKRLAALAALFIIVLAATPARAELIRITPQGLTPAQYEALGMPLDPAIIGPGGFRLTYWGGGKETLLNPVEIIIGVPGSGPGTAPTLTVGAIGGVSIPSIETGDTQTRYGGSWNTTTGYATTFSSSSPKSNVYDLIGFTPQGSPSQNYANWNGATGIASWQLFVISVTFVPNLMNQGDYAEFNVTGGLPNGSYVVGYGQTPATKKNPGDAESTPFTFAGLVQVKVPEPSSVSESATGAGLVILLGAALRRRKSRQTA